jgi:hypothetical protein
MARLTDKDKSSATSFAKVAFYADKLNDVTLRDQAIRDLANVVGYYLNSSRPTTAEFRGEAVPPLMLRMPNGRRAVAWDKRQKAVEAWASCAT